uniref:Uncharacterized protein n=1 Tax=Octopus bimaculoides TaxID=37653 RepID=A0A0L8HWJ4_OCTBM
MCISAILLGATCIYVNTHIHTQSRENKRNIIEESMHRERKKALVEEERSFQMNQMQRGCYSD